MTLSSRALRPLLFLAAALSAGAAVYWAFLAGLLGEVTAHASPRTPPVHMTLPAARVGCLHIVDRPCPGSEPMSRDEVDSWMTWLEGLSWSPTRLNAVDLDEGLEGLALVVAPRASGLSATEGAALRRHVRVGGRLLAVRSPGERDEKGGTVGWGLLEELLGAERFERLPGDTPAFIAFPAGSPLSAGLEALMLEPPEAAGCWRSRPGWVPTTRSPKTPPRAGPRRPSSWDAGSPTSCCCT